MRMRLLTLLLVILVSAFPVPGVSAEQSSPITLSRSAIETPAHELIVEGTHSEGANQMITMILFAPNGQIETMDQQGTDENGVFRFTYAIKDIANGDYLVKIGGSNVVIPIEKIISYHKQGGETPGPVTPIPQHANAPKGRIVLTPTEFLTSAKNGKVIIQLPAEAEKVQMPILSMKSAKDTMPIVVHGEKWSLEFPSKLLKQLLDNGYTDLEFQMQNVNPANLESTNFGKNIVAKNITPIYEIQLRGIANQETRMINAFSESVRLEFRWSGDEGIDTELLGVYTYAHEEEKWIYVGGEIGTGDGDEVMAIDLSHFSMYSVFQYKELFEDVSPSKWYARTIEVAAAKHIITGVDENRFAPDRPTTRAEFVQTLVGALGLEGADPARLPFNDVESDAWYADAIANAYKAGFIQGRETERFSPNEAVTRQEAAAILGRVLHAINGPLEGLTGSGEPTYKDGYRISEWAMEGVAVMQITGIMVGSNEQFRPLATMTRAEMTQSLLSFTHWMRSE